MLRSGLGPEKAHEPLAADTTLVCNGKESQESERPSLARSTRARASACLNDGAAQRFQAQHNADIARV